MHARKLLFGIITTLILVSLSGAQQTTSDMPECYREIFQMREAHGPGHVAWDETDDSTNYDVLYYNIEIKFTPSTHYVQGKVDMKIKATTAGLVFVNMNLRNNMTVDSVKVGTTTVASSFTGLDDFRVTLPQPLALNDSVTVTTYYKGYPITGSMGALSWGTHLGTYIISSLSQPEGSRTWWPCKDVTWDKANSARMVWTVPSTLYATSNGLLLSVTTPTPGWKAYEWKENYPIPTYLIPVTATNFAHFRNWYVTVGNDSMPLDHYVYPEDSLDATVDFADLDEVITFFASVFGEYPFLEEKYGHSEFPWGGAMEHQTNTSYGADLINGLNTYHWIMVHELSHQWWGDMVTCETWADIWLNEGTATYCDALWTEFDQGQTAFQARMEDFRQTYFWWDETGEGRFPIFNPDYMWGGTVYQKGAWIEHMLRYVVGETDFWNFWGPYRNAYAFDNVSTVEFQQTWENVSGMDLDWFFDEWVYLAGYPEYQWGWTTTSIGNGYSQVNVSIQQVQELVNQTPIFNMPIELQIVKSTGTETVVAQDSLASQNFSFVVNGTVQDVLFDPDVWILKTAQEGTYQLPPQTVTISSAGSPVIPPTGGSFNYTVSVANTATAPATFEAWIMVRLPNSTWYGPVLGPFNLTLASGVTLSRVRTQNVPASAPAGIYWYQARIGDYPDVVTAASTFTFLKQADLDGGNIGDFGDWSNSGESFDPWVTAVSMETPQEFALVGAYPNPFNPATVISYQLSVNSQVSLQVYDTAGKLVQTLVEGWREAGAHEARFDGTAFASGIYLYRLNAGDFTATGKMVLLK